MRVSLGSRSSPALRQSSTPDHITENFRVYGVRKVRRQLLREGVAVARFTVGRRMKAPGLQGAIRGKPMRTTISDKGAPCPLDRVNRQFRAPAPNRLWASDFTYVLTWSGFVYVASVTDAYARRIVGWRVSGRAHAGFVLDALEQALDERRPARGGGLVHQPDRGSHYVSIRCTEGLKDPGLEPSVGSVGDSYDNALAETINGLFKAEVIHPHGPWRSPEAVEFATLEWVGWFNHRRPLEPIGSIRQRKPNCATMRRTRSAPLRRDSDKTACGKNGAVQTASSAFGTKRSRKRPAIALAHITDAVLSAIRKRNLAPKPARETFAANPKAAIRVVIRS